MSEGSQMLIEGSAHSTKQATKNARAGGRTLAPFPNTIHNQAEIGEETFENLMQWVSKVRKLGSAVDNFGESVVKLLIPKLW